MGNLEKLHWLDAFAVTGYGVRVGGNIGNPLIAEVEGAGAQEWVVAEVSSFQLETIRAFRPRVAVLLNHSTYDVAAAVIAADDGPVHNPAVRSDSTDW